MQIYCSLRSLLLTRSFILPFIFSAALKLPDLTKTLPKQHTREGLWHILSLIKPLPSAWSTLPALCSISLTAMPWQSHLLSSAGCPACLVATATCGMVAPGWDTAAPPQLWLLSTARAAHGFVHVPMARPAGRLTWSEARGWETLQKWKPE